MEARDVMTGSSRSGFINILRPGAATVWTQNYTYDGVNRLLTANERIGTGSVVLSQTYSCDLYGNRWTSSSLGIATSYPPEPTAQNHYTAANNRLSMSGVDCDAAGNKIKYDELTLGYDAEGRNTKARENNAGYVAFAYDGEGRRAKKTSGGITTYYIYNALGQLAAEKGE